MRDGKAMRAMINSFSDTSDTDYDRAIAESKKRMEKCDPCENVRELDSLITRLNMFKSTYYTRPCIEGYCFGVFVPHRGRIDRRVAAFKEERKVHEQDCQDFLRERDRKEKQEEHKAELDTKVKIKEMEIKSQEEISKAEIEAMTKNVETHTSERRGLFHRK